MLKSQRCAKVLGSGGLIFYVVIIALCRRMGRHSHNALLFARAAPQHEAPSNQQQQQQSGVLPSVGVLLELQRTPALSSSRAVGLLSRHEAAIGGANQTVAGGRLSKCPAECHYDWIGDNWCDSACANEECENDGGDCDGWCAPDCKASWIGDSFCDLDCFRPECNYDGGDCKGRYTEGAGLLSFPRRPHDAFDYSGCPETCDRSLLHNLFCDDACNSPECNLDGGDCNHLCSATCPAAWLGDGECDYGCRSEACHFDKGDCDVCSEGCEPGMIGNGICDVGCNNDKCHFDMGDCYGVCWAADRIEYFQEPFFYPHCRTEWRGDGSCDCFCMTAACDFDYGDCDNQNCTLQYESLRVLYQRLGIELTNFPLPPS